MESSPDRQAIPDPGLSRELPVALARLFERLDSAASDGAGVVLLHHPDTDRPLGLVMAEQGEVFWATAAASEVSLSERILALTGMDRGHLQTLCRDAQAEDVSLGELLVERSVLSRQDLRRVLLEHIGSTLGTLLRNSLEDGARWSGWKPASAVTDSTSGFDAVEVVRAVRDQDVQLRLELAAPPAGFDALLDQSDETVCYQVIDWEEQLALPVAASPALELPLPRSLRLFRLAATSLVQISLRILETRPRLVWTEHDGHGVVAARHGDHVIVSRCRRPDLGLLTSWLLRNRLASGSGSADG